MNVDAKLQQLMENMRFYGEMRFKQLTLFVALLSLLGAGISQFGNNMLVPGIKIEAVLAIAGMLFTGVLWIMEVKASRFWVALREEAGKLEKVEGQEEEKVSSSLWVSPKALLQQVNATNAVLVLYMSVFAFWVFCAHHWIANLWVTTASVLIGCFLLLFSCLSYMPMWTYKEPQKDE